VQEFKNIQSLEVVYPQLPPQAGFKIVFKSPGNGIEYRDVTISHDAGVAQEALAKTEPGLLGTLLPWVYFVLVAGYIILNINSFRKTSAETWRMQAEDQSPLQTLGADKPWYIPEKSWGTIRRTAVSRKIRSDYIMGSSIQKSAAYQLLSVEKPDKVDSKEWAGVVSLAVDSLNKTYLSAVKSAYIESDLIELLQVKRPNNFASEKWDDLEKRANEQFIDFRTRKLYSAESLRQALLDHKPDAVSEVAWDKHISHVQEQYSELLLIDLKTDSLPFKCWGAQWWSRVL
jgi:hypothetical protein